jgi:uncharacterized protein with HEPN domain
MRLESKKYLYDVLQAAKQVEEFCRGKSFADYEADALLRSAVERQFEIIGEALRQLGRDDPATGAKISEQARIVAFRNILIHGYAHVDDRIVWDVLETKLPTLVTEVEALLEQN